MYSKGDAVRKAQVPLADLSASLGSRNVKRFVNELDLASGQPHVQEIVQCLPAEPVLNKGPSLVHDIVRSLEQPSLSFRSLKKLPRLRMKRIGPIQQRVKS